MHQEDAQLRSQGVRIEDEWLRRIGPVHFGHINFRGTMRFGVEPYVQSLVQPRNGSPARLQEGGR